MIASFTPAWPLLLSATTKQFLLLPVDHRDRGVNGLSVANC
jgi:hypothetical protein